MAVLKYWDATQNQYVIASGGPSVAYGQVAATAPPTANPTVSPPMGLLWMDTSVDPATSPYIPPQTPPATGLNTVTDGSSEVWVSKNGSAWRRARDVAVARVYLSANQSITVSGNTTINLNAITYDLLNQFTAPTYTAPLAGRYLLQGAIGFNAIPTVAGAMQSTFSVNGTQTSQGTSNYYPASGLPAWPSSEVHDIVLLNANDTVGLIIWNAPAQTIPVMGDPNRTYLAISYLGPRA